MIVIKNSFIYFWSQNDMKILKKLKFLKSTVFDSLAPWSRHSKFEILGKIKVLTVVIVADSLLAVGISRHCDVTFCLTVICQKYSNFLKLFGKIESDAPFTLNKCWVVRIEWIARSRLVSTRVRLKCMFGFGMKTEPKYFRS